MYMYPKQGIKLLVQQNIIILIYNTYCLYIHVIQSCIIITHAHVHSGVIDLLLLAVTISIKFIKMDYSGLSC